MTHQTIDTATRVDVLAVMDRARDVLAETYAKYQTKIGPFASQSQQSNVELRYARDAVAELIEHNRIMREALTKLARAPGCGCSPVCRCGEGDWTRYELEGRMDYAQEALAKATGAKP